MTTYQQTTMRLVNGKFNVSPSTVGDVLLNLLNNFKFDYSMAHVISYILDNTTTISLEKHVSEIDHSVFSDEQLKKLKRDYYTIQTHTRFKTIEEFMSYKTIPIATKNEELHYVRQKDKAKFSSPAEEYEWAINQFKTCSKCEEYKNFTQFKGNTSGCDAFDKDGYRLRRPECEDCGKEAGKGKSEAKKKAKELGIDYKAPEGTVCSICNKPPTKGNGIVFDHCHEKNVFRGYCCNSCNRSMGVLGDNVEGILKVLNYMIRAAPCKIRQNEDFTMTLDE